MEPSPRQRKLYWLCADVQQVHRNRALRLADIGYQVQFFSRIEQLEDALSRERPIVVFIGDEGETKTVIGAIRNLTTMPEAQGIRYLLSVSRSEESLHEFAAAWSFRDFIALDLDERSWLERFIFASARSPVKLPDPQVAIAVNRVAAVSLPTRITWISQNSIMIETKLKAQPGISLTLVGAFVQSLGLQRLNCKVERTQKSDFSYRFSDGIVLRFDISDNTRSMALLAALKQSDFGPRIKVFLVIKSRDLRKQIIRDLDPLRFDVSAALQKQSIVDEPKYFSPNVAIIEASLLKQREDQSRFLEMMESMPSNATVLVIGDKEILPEVRKLIPPSRVQRVVALTHIPNKISEWLLARQPGEERKANAGVGAVHLSHDHPLSFAELQLPARLLRMHPNSVCMSVPYEIGSYGLVRIESQEYRRAMGIAPYAKLNRVYPDDTSHDKGFAFTFVANISTALATQREAFGKYAADLVREKLFPEDVTAELKQTNTASVSPLVIPAADLGTHKDQTQALPIEAKNEQTQTSPQTSVDLIQKTRTQIRLIDDSSNGSFEVDLVKLASDVFLSKSAINIYTFAAVSLAGAAILYFVATSVAPNWNKSGGEYTDALRKFSPKRFEEEQKAEPESGH